MVNISVDESFAFDLLSIADVKIFFGGSEHSANYNRLAANLVENIGFEDHSRILGSEEYRELYKTNFELFGQIDKLKIYHPTGENAKKIDELNYYRFICKKRLQDKFFPNSPITERKIGY